MLQQHSFLGVGARGPPACKPTHRAHRSACVPCAQGESMPLIEGATGTDHRLDDQPLASFSGRSGSHQSYVTRRAAISVLTGLTFATLIRPPTARADPPVQEESPTPWSSNVPATLSAKEYAAIIAQDRPACWKLIAQQVQATNFAALSEDLDEQPFADLRQAAFYIPWALLQRDDYAAATDTRKSFNDFESHVLDLQSAALGASVGQTEPATVQQAFILMSASLDSFLASIPTTYIQGPKA